MFMSGRQFLKEWQVTDKIIEWFLFYNSYFTFYKWLKFKKLIGFWKFTNGYKWCVWVGEHFLSHEKWEIKLLSVFFFQFIFYILQMTLTQ